MLQNMIEQSAILFREGYKSLHLLSSVDVHALVEMLLEVGNHGIVPGYTVDTSVLQTCCFHNITTQLHYQRDKL